MARRASEAHAQQQGHCGARRQDGPCRLGGDHQTRRNLRTSRSGNCLTTASTDCEARESYDEKVDRRIVSSVQKSGLHKPEPVEKGARESHRGLAATADPREAGYIYGRPHLVRVSSKLFWPLGRLQASIRSRIDPDGIRGTASKHLNALKRAMYPSDLAAPRFGNRLCHQSSITLADSSTHLHARSSQTAAGKARAGSYRLPRIMIAQAMRASLLARATVATFIGRRSSRCSIQGVRCTTERWRQPTIARAPWRAGAGDSRRRAPRCRRAALCHHSVVAAAQGRARPQTDDRIGTAGDPPPLRPSHSR
jgi:hypothetical protein